MSIRGWRERRILARLREEESKNGKHGLSLLHPLLDDPLQQASFYKPLVAPFRAALALRYLHHKKHLLASYQARGSWPSDVNRFKQELTERLRQAAGSGNSKGAFAVWWMHRMVVGVLVLILAGSLLGLSLTERDHEAFSHVLVHDLVNYGDKVHQARSLRQLLILGSEDDEKAQALLAEVNDDIAQRRKILVGSLPDVKDLLEKMTRTLDLFEKDSPDEGKLYAALGDVNRALDEAGIPYYIDASMVTASCVSLLPLPPNILQLLMQMAGEQPEAQAVCRSGMLFPHWVEDRWTLRSGENEHPLFFLRRVDGLPVVKSVLGLTTQGGYGATVHLDRLEKYVRQSVLPMLVVDGQGSMMPLRSVEVPGLRHLVSGNLRQAVASLLEEGDLARLKRYVSKRNRQKGRLTQARLRQSLFRMDSAKEGTPEEGISGMPVDALSGLLDSYIGKPGKQESDPRVSDAVEFLRDELAQAVAFHEFQHLLNQDHFVTPSWADRVFSDIPTKEGQRHALEELSAYLVTIKAGKGLRLIHLTQIALFAFNPGLHDSAEDIAARMILPALIDEARSDVQPVRRLRSDEDVMMAFTALSALPDAMLGRLAEQAYERLMETPMPSMTRD